MQPLNTPNSFCATEVLGAEGRPILIARTPGAFLRPQCDDWDRGSRRRGRGFCVPFGASTSSQRAVAVSTRAVFSTCRPRRTRPK